MNKQIPIVNRIISYKQLQRNWNIHETRLKNIKPTFQVRSNSNNSNRLVMSSRKNIQTYNRMIQIQLQNRALLKKLTERQQNRSTKHEQHKLIKNNRKQYYQQHTRRIENQGLLRRIKQTKTSYKTRKYMQQRKDTQRYLNLISKFGYKDLKPTKTILQFHMRNSRHIPNNQQKQNEQRQTLPIYNEQDKPLKMVKTKKILNRDKQGHQIPLQIKISQFQNKFIIEINIKNTEDLYFLDIKKQLLENKYNNKLKSVVDLIAYNQQADYFYLQ